MKRAPLESTIQASIRKRLLSLGCWLAPKVSPSQWGYRIGALDITGIYRGRGFCIEVKRPGPKHDFAVDTLCPHCWREMTPAQRAELMTVRAAGGLAHVATSADEAEAIVMGAI